MQDDSTLVTVRVRNRRSSAYHTDPDDCQAVGADTNTEEITVAEAKRRGLELCRWCDDDTEVETDGYDRSILDAASEYDPDPIDEVVR